MVARPDVRRRPLAAVPTITGTPWQQPSQHQLRGMDTEATLDLGWGRLVFGQTFADPQRLVEVLRGEAEGRRDICIYPRDPQVLLGLAPGELFLDPSLTFRLDLHRYRPRRELVEHVFVRTVTCPDDVAEMGRVLRRAGMLPGDPATVWHDHSTGTVRYLVAEDRRTGRVVGTVTGVDHVRAFGDPEGGSSLWCLAADPDAAPPGTGEALVRVLAERHLARGRAYLDLSVLHDNAPAIALYRKLGFRQVPALVVKRCNARNAPLFVPGPPGLDRLAPSARVIADEALRRGIRVEVTDAASGEMRFTLGARSVLTRESLSELTTAVGLGRCEDGRVTRRVVAGAGVRVPVTAEAPEDDLAPALALLGRFGELVVRPARGDPGRGVTAGVRDRAGLLSAVARARRHCTDVLLEEPVAGEEVRVVVVDAEVVAAAVRRPATVVGDGVSDVTTLVRRTGRRRERATAGRSRIPLDDATVAAVAEAGWAMDDVPPAGERIRVRPTADLRSGGTVEDVTDRLHPEIAAAAVRAARAIGVPVAGLDLLVPDLDGPGCVLLGADAQPGLADHGARPTAARFVDLLFPETRSR
ncbi:GNAT-family acetyltransferase (TIGR03103 family) [Geodermatophilus tzadiensis]|uniref:GNAT-family acetyltransferase (TIGR03103 family) n=1 Tax=Geodermatophilus tzadiensis TaxID=1137988 RepID=A0A2T0U060_9ACTN|nr:N-acetylglutaminylglutamine synthetase [Geodermatophilus tzadiensis]PRY51305.1 GNAT-family acetyltransferase (TIGR03103 family) [Geodermatophilus tzadiensis]